MPTHTSGNPVAIPELAAARGKIGKVAAWDKFGYNTSVSNSAAEVIWEGGGATYGGFLTSAGTVSVVSSSINDDAAGPARANAHKIIIEGLDSNWAVATEEITLDGTGAVTGSTSFFRVYRAYVTDVGVYGNTNAGNITISIGGTPVAIIGAGYGQTEMAIYTVPASKTLYLTQIDAFADTTSREFTVQLKQRLNADDSVAPVSGIRLMRVLTTSNPSPGTVLELNGAISFPAKTDIWVEALADTSGSGLTVSLQGYLVDD